MSLSLLNHTTILAAAGEGMVTYRFTPEFELDIPARTYQGVYTAEVYVTAVLGQ